MIKKQLLILIVMAVVLVLVACASPTAVGTTQPSFSDTVATVVAATMQAVETFPGRQVVAYALGNFVFDQQPGRARQGVVFEAVFQGEALERWELHPIYIHNFYQPRWAEPGEAEAILTRIEAASVELPDR